MCIAAQPKWQPMARSTTLGKFQAGFGYIAVLFIALILAIFSGVTYEQLNTVLRRDKENEWLFVGNQYQQAVASYYNNSPNGLKALPKSIDDLVNDKRFLKTQHHLRKPFADPITGGNWLLISNGQGEIKGVVSSANLPILQSAQVQALASNSNQADGDMDALYYNTIKFEFNLKNSLSSQENSGEEEFVENNESNELDSLNASAVD